MEWLTKLYNYVSKVCGGSSSSTNTNNKVKNTKQPLLTGAGKSEPAPNEIKMMPEISDEQLQTKNNRSQKIDVIQNADYKVKKGDNIEKIAQKYGITTIALLAANGLDETSAKKIQQGKVLKIPPTRKLKNVNNLNDIAQAMGVSLDFIKKLKRLEDSQNLADNQFHRTPYIDDAGVRTIGIGHRLVKGDKENLTNSEVCTLCAKDLLKAEDHLVTLLGSQKLYDQIPAALKESVLDLTFNKGVIDDKSFKSLIYCLKNGKWEAAINQLTYNKSINTGKEMSGLNKRRVFDIANATKIYKGKIPQSNINTAQQVYNRGVELLRAECKAKGLKFENQIAGYNNDIKKYLDGRFELKLITA